MSICAPQSQLSRRLCALRHFAEVRRKTSIPRLPSPLFAAIRHTKQEIRNSSRSDQASLVHYVLNEFRI